MDIYKLNFTVLEQEFFSLLCWKAGIKLSQRDIAKMLNVSPTAVANSLKKLSKLGLVCFDRMKTINFVSLNRDNSKVIDMKKIENLKGVYLSGLVDFFKDNLAGATVVLFGSYFRGEDLERSDVDIAVIGRNKKVLDLEKYEQILNRKINVNYYKSWNDCGKELRNNILNGIVLVGGVEL